MVVEDNSFSEVEEMRLSILPVAVVLVSLATPTNAVTTIQL